MALKVTAIFTQIQTLSRQVLQMFLFKLYIQILFLSSLYLNWKKIGIENAEQRRNTRDLHLHHTYIFQYNCGSGLNGSTGFLFPVCVSV